MVNCCHLCGKQTEIWIEPRRQLAYHHCLSCDFVQLDSSHYLPLEDARKRYQLHCNQSDNEGYLNWLERLIRQAVLPWKTQGKALDYGSGPEPLLVSLLQEYGFEVQHYDLHFAPGDEWRSEHFDLITLCEVIEHLDAPRILIAELAELLKPEGLLVIRTRFSPPDQIGFMNWWYREDPTHISFFHPENIVAVAEAAGLQVVAINPPDIAVCQKL